jgi:hypothetical protein
MGDKTENAPEQPAQGGGGQGDQPNSGPSPASKPQNPFTLEPVTKGIKPPKPRQ